MTANFQISRVTALPDPLEANMVYMVATGASGLEVYATGNTSAARRVLNKSDVQALIDTSISGLSGVEVVDDIAARDALALTANTIVMVLDASGDATVTSGAATYAYRHSGQSFSKVSEYESLDLSFAWGNITGRPDSPPDEIDAAVAATHGHTNKAQLDNVGESASGGFTYNGKGYVQSGASEW